MPSRMHSRHRLVALGRSLFLSSVLAAVIGKSVDFVPTSYIAYRFESTEHWRTMGSGNLGKTSWAGKTWSLDFSEGAAWISLSPPDLSLLGKVNQLRLRVRGNAKGHPIHLYLRTHFMTFHKVVPGLTGEGEQELQIDGPPGPGWQWFGGENDGKIHGPIRVGEIRLEANGLRDRCTLEMFDLTIEGTCPPQQRCVLSAEIATTNQATQFKAVMRALSDTGLEGKLRWQMRAWNGQQLAQGERPVSVPARGEPLAMSIPAPPITVGLRFLETEFSLDVPGQNVPAAQACWLAPLQPQVDANLKPQSPFGMGIYLCRYHGAEREQVATLARQAGVKWSREDFSLRRIAPEPGRFDWHDTDDLVACAKRNGITVYAIVMGWPAWTQPYSEAAIEGYTQILRVLVQRYRQDIKQWEIWNEPNIFFWQGPKELYATMLIKSYAVVKATDPTAEVLGLSTAGIDVKFIDQMLALKTPFDVLTIHPYRKVLDDQTFINDLKKVSDLVLLPDGTRRPVWLTEMGWATHNAHNALKQDFQPNTMRVQAELIARTYLCSIVSGVEPRTFWYDFRNDGEDPFNFEHCLGIVYRDFRPKPAYHAYSTLTQVLDERKLVGSLTLGEGVFAYRFSSSRLAQGDVITLWHPQRDELVTVPVKGEQVELINTIGEVQELSTTPGADAEQGRTVRIQLRKGAPVYVLEKRTP